MPQSPGTHIFTFCGSQGLNSVDHLDGTHIDATLLSRFLQDFPALQRIPDPAVILFLRKRTLK